MNPLESTVIHADSHTPMPTPELDAAFSSRLQALSQALQTLPDKPEETPDSALRALWHLAADQPLSVIAAQDLALPALTAAQLERLDALLALRLQGTPLAYITGWQRFMGLDLRTGPEALIPRRETEMLGLAVQEKLRELADARGSVRVIDVCCGSGNLALALAHAEPRAEVHASDLSPDAVCLARKNTALLRLESRVQLHTGDLLAPFNDSVFVNAMDMIVSAPPYISSAKLDTMPAEIIGHEPQLAFDGGPFGVGILMRLMRESPALLRAGGWLGLEVGLGQGSAMLQLLRKNASYDAVETICDDDGQIRVLLARKRAEDRHRA